MQHILYVHVERAQKLGDDHFKEFGSLLRTAKGEADSMPELKTTVVKAIDVPLCKLNSKENWLMKILSEALVALTNNQENSSITSSADKKDERL